jgi:hypothetical protein
MRLFNVCDVTCAVEYVMRYYGSVQYQGLYCDQSRNVPGTMSSNSSKGLLPRLAFLAVVMRHVSQNSSGSAIMFTSFQNPSSCAIMIVDIDLCPRRRCISDCPMLVSFCVLGALVGLCVTAFSCVVPVLLYIGGTSMEAVVLPSWSNTSSRIRSVRNETCPPPEFHSRTEMTRRVSPGT